MKNTFVLAVIIMFTFAFTAFGQKNHSQKNENANLTPEQKMARDNDKVHKKKKGKNDTTKKKVKRAKKNDRASRRKKN